MDTEAQGRVQGPNRLYINEQIERQGLVPYNPEGTRWKGKCWYVHNHVKYEFDLQFNIPATAPELDGKTKRCTEEGKLLDSTFQAAMGEELPQIWHCTRTLFGYCTMAK